MAMVLKIDTIDRSTNVDWTSIRRRDELNQKTDILRFKIIKYGTSKTFKPELNQEVELTNNSTKVFGGIIVRITDKVFGKDILTYQVECKDFTQTLNRELVTERYEDKTIDFIINDLLGKYATTFTDTNVKAPILVGSIAFNRINLSLCLEKLAQLVGYSWYVDYDKDVHFFAKNEETAPFNLTDTSGNYIYRSLEFFDDLSQLRNKILVQGGEQEGASRTESFIGNATDSVDTFKLGNKFSSKPTVVVDSISQTVGIDFLDDDLSFDCMWNFNEKYIRFTAGNIPIDNDIIDISGIPLFPIVIETQSDASIAEFGIYEHAILDKTITSQNQAIDRAIAELNAYGLEIVEGTFRTYQDNLMSGQVINIQSTIRGRDEDVLIQSITLKPRTPNGDPEYLVKFATLRTIGIIDVLQKLLRQEELTQGENETLLNFFNFKDSLSISDLIGVPTTLEGPYFWADATGGNTEMVWNFFTWT